MREYLEQRAPCIYIPNYDDRHSCIIPTLSPAVKVVGIGHSDDAQHYAHILSLAPYWDAIVGVSSAVTESIASLAPGIEARQWTIPYGVPVPQELRVRAASPVTRAAYAGRLVRFQKRALDLVSIADELRARGVDVELTVAGTGTEMSEFLAAAGSVMLSRHLRYVGGLTNEQVHELIAESDVFVLPSSFEGLPVSLLEAMANGCVPVVSAIRSGVPEVITNGENGFTVPIGDIEAFADRITMLAADSELLSRLRANAYATARDRFSVERMTSSYLEVFETVVGRPYERPQGSIKPPPDLSPIEALMPRFPMPVRRLVWRVRGRK
jgi:glycosyltransferase involved in cell wall biosynthesis